MKYKKASGIVSAIINGAIGVTGAIATSPGALGIIMAILVGLMAAAEVAVIASQPIPSYAKGRKGGKAEFANVGEKGTEKVITADGQEYYTPSSSTLAFLPEGAKVIPHHELIEQARLAAFNHSDYSDSLMDYQLFSTNTRIDQTNEKLDNLSEVIKNKKELYLSIDKRGWHTAMKDGNYWTEYVSNNIRL
jgi:SLT domain-containing protein